MKTVTLHFKEEWSSYEITEDQANHINKNLADDEKESFSFEADGGTTVWVKKASLDTVIIEKSEEE